MAAKKNAKSPIQRCCTRRKRVNELFLSLTSKGELMTRISVRSARKPKELTKNTVLCFAGIRKVPAR